jgi:serine/threonine protein phosphatase 1
MTSESGYMSRLVAAARTIWSGNNLDGNLVALLPIDPKGKPVYAVGDLHGCADLYRTLEQKIMADAALFGGEAVVVLLGDVVDRGPQSALLLDHLTAIAPAGMTRHCILGNHEDMMNAFLKSPKRGRSWLDFGGFETLLSYGLRIGAAELAEFSERRLLQMLQAHIPQAHRDFLEQLPYGLTFDRYVLVHAAAATGAPMTRQPRETLLWGRHAAHPNANLTVVHGHSIVDHPVVGPELIATDTGAYLSGVLSAVRLLHGVAPVVVQIS